MEMREAVSKPQASMPTAEAAATMMRAAVMASSETCWPSTDTSIVCSSCPGGGPFCIWFSPVARTASIAQLASHTRLVKISNVLKAPGQFLSSTARTGRSAYKWATQWYNFGRRTMLYPIQAK